MKNEKIKAKVASFLEAFNKFLSYSDEESVSLSSLKQFAELKEKGRISYRNETSYWCGNHHSSEEKISMFYNKEPLDFFVVEYRYYENSDNSHERVERHIFVPNK